ncbi:MAG: fibronectin type III domain-containing protein [Treponema sp.]|nr:fibronectin type III domain-containing protein [Treponema sp.]
MKINKKLFVVVFISILFFIPFFSCTLPFNETATDSISTSKPVSPTGIISSSDYDGITISWNPVKGALSYKIYYAASNTSFSGDCFYESKTNTYTDTLLYAGDIWFYRVSAVNLNGEGDSTNPVYSSRQLQYGNRSQVVSSATSLTVYSQADTTVRWTIGNVVNNNPVYYYFPVKGGKNYKIYWIDSRNNSEKLTDFGYTDQAYICVYYYPAGSSSTTFYSGDGGTATLYTGFESQITGYYIIKTAGNNGSSGSYGLCVIGE